MSTHGQVTPSQWFRGTPLQEIREDGPHVRPGPSHHTSSAKITESIFEEKDDAEQAHDFDAWILDSLRKLNDLCRSRRARLTNAEQYLEAMRVAHEKATVAADAARRGYEAYERSVDQGRLYLAQAVGRCVRDDEREAMNSKVEELISSIPRSVEADAGGIGDCARETVKKSSSVGSYQSTVRPYQPSVVMETPPAHANTRRGMPTPLSMPRLLAGEPESPKSPLSKRRGGWDLRGDFLHSSPSRLP